MRVAAVLLALLLGVAGCRDKPQPRVVVNGRTFQVEVADSEPVRHRGLGGRLSLPEGRGMLFVFQKEEPLVFYMKDCHFPIDIAFIDSRGRIVKTATMAVEADPARPRTYYHSDAPARYALEVLGGAWQRLGVEAGMTVQCLDVPGAP